MTATELRAQLEALGAVVTREPVYCGGLEKPVDALVARIGQRMASALVTDGEERALELLLGALR